VYEWFSYNPKALMDSSYMVDAVITWFFLLASIIYEDGSTEAFKKYLNDGAPVRSLNASHGLPEIILL
jgi:hypothetical protein